MVTMKPLIGIIRESKISGSGSEIKICYRVNFLMKKQNLVCFFLETFSLFDFVLLFKSSMYQKILDLNQMEVPILIAFDLHKQLLCMF